LRISRHWAQPPDWFDSLDAQTQTDLIADYILDNESQKDKDARKKQYNVQQARRIKKRFSSG